MHGMFGVAVGMIGNDWGWLEILGYAVGDAWGMLDDACWGWLRIVAWGFLGYMGMECLVKLVGMVGMLGDAW